MWDVGAVMVVVVSGAELKSRFSSPPSASYAPLSPHFRPFLPFVLLSRASSPLLSIKDTV